MTIQELAKAYNRMCKIYDAKYCDGCPLNTNENFLDEEACTNAIVKYPDEFEKILVKWMEEHKTPTNREKFFKVFGKQTYCDRYCENCETELPCYDCDWWNEEYIEPEGVK